MVPLCVVGAHLSGQPLNHQLTDRGGRLVEATTTAAAYRLFALDTTPAKPGMVRADEGGAAIEVEVWSLPSLDDFAATCVVAPLRLGPVELADGSEVTGFLCDPGAVAGAPEITAYGGWLRYLGAPADPPH